MLRDHILLHNNINRFVKIERGSCITCAAFDKPFNDLSVLKLDWFWGLFTWYRNRLAIRDEANPYFRSLVLPRTILFLCRFHYNRERHNLHSASRYYRINPNIYGCLLCFHGEFSYNQSAVLIWWTSWGWQDARCKMCEVKWMLLIGTQIVVKNSNVTEKNSK